MVMFSSVIVTDMTTHIKQKREASLIQMKYYNITLVRIFYFTSRSLRSMRFLEVNNSSSPLFSLSPMAWISASHTLLWSLIIMSTCRINSWTSGTQDDRTELEYRWTILKQADVC